MASKTLEFRHLFVSSAVNENTVTVFGEQGTVYQKGTDYDEMIEFHVSSRNLSNLIAYYNGNVPDGQYGSADMPSLISVNAPVSSIQKFNSGYQLLPGGGVSSNILSKENGIAGGKYNLGAVVLFSPDGNPDNASCWTCIRTTSIPGDNAIPAVGTVDPSKVGTQYKGFYGTDRNGQNFLQGVRPAEYDPVTKIVTPSPYWSESAIAKSYQTSGNYYNNELVVYNGAVYQVKTTDGKMCDPALYQNANTTAEQEKAGVSPTSVAIAPNGAFGYDSVGSRYIQGVPPSGGPLSSFFWKASSLPLVPVSTYTYINWDNVEVNSKLVYFDNNMPGGNGAQAFDSFADDADTEITTLRKIYNDNEKGFVLDVAQSILSRIPAAAIKSQSVGQRPEPDSTLVEMVHSGPHETAPDNYQPTVQGVFEEALFEDMLQIGGFKGSVVNYTVTDPSSGYTSVPAVRVSTDGLATNPILVPFGARAVARLGLDSIFIDTTDATWAGATGYQVGDDLEFVDDSNSIGKSFYTRAKAEIYGVDPLSGRVTHVKITSPGSGYTSVPAVKDKNANILTFLKAILKVVSVDESNSFIGFTNGGTVKILYGSGQGATGAAVVEDGRLTGVNVTYGGSGYQSGEYKQDIVKLQGLDGSGNAVSQAVAPAVVTYINPVSGAIGATGISILLGGSGYSSAPSVSIDGPAINRDATAGVTAGDRNILTVTNAGRYHSAPSAVYNSWLSVSAGVSNVEITNSGAGYSVGDSLVFSGGGYSPASFTTSFADDTYSLTVANGGGGYRQNDVLVVSDGTTGGDQLTATVTACGGQVTAASFNPLTPFGSNYSVGSTFKTSEDVLFEVQSVGAPGQLLASVLNNVAGDSVGTGATGYQVGDVLIATPKYFSIKQVDIVNNGTYYSKIPTVTIAAPLATDPNLTNVTATATATLSLASIFFTEDFGSRGGDVISIDQPQATNDARIVVLSTDSGGRILTYKMSDAGSGFDPEVPCSISSSNPNASLGTPSPRFTVSNITVTNPGLGYTDVPVAASLSDAVSNLPSQVTTASRWKSGGGGTFEIMSLPVSSLGGLQLLNPGSGYIATDFVELGRPSGDANGPVSGLYFNPTSSNLLSGNVMSAKVLASPAGFTVGMPLTLGGSTCVVTQLSPSDSISAISVSKYVPGETRYTDGTALSHKALTVATVNTVNVATGAITSLLISNPGYGYSQKPTVTIRSNTGQNATFNVPYLTVTRAEWIASESFSVDNLDIHPPSTALPAQAVANITGSLYNLDLDQQRNPNLLTALENVKTGSTTGYAQATPNLGVAAVTVQETGRNLGNFGDLSVVFSAPDLPDGVTPVAVIDSSGFNDSLKAVTYITVLNPGSGYSKPPSVVISNKTGVIPTVAAMLKPVMKLTGVNLTSRGLGFVNPPTVTISKPDYGSAVAPTAVTTLQSRVQSFEVNYDHPGAHYTEVPNMTVVSQGTGAVCAVSMGVSDIKIISGGTGGFLVGDALTFTGGNASSPAEAVVSKVDSKGVITAVILNDTATESGQDVHGNTVAVLKNSDFTGFGGDGYTVPPTVTEITRNGTRVSACGGESQPKFSCRLGVHQFTVSQAGSNFVCDGQVIVEPPPASQAARYAAVVNAGNGTISSFAQIEAGNGYSTAPNVQVVGGGGVNAAASAIMGISDLFIADGGTGYALGDVVNIPCPGGTTASAVVTGLDEVPSTANPLAIQLSTTALTFGSTGSVSGGGAMNGYTILNGGEGFKIGDVISYPSRSIPTQFTGNGVSVSFIGDKTFDVTGTSLSSFGINIPTGASEEDKYAPGDLFKIAVSATKYVVARLNWVGYPDGYGGTQLRSRTGFSSINWKYPSDPSNFSLRYDLPNAPAGGVNSIMNYLNDVPEFIGVVEPMFTVLSSHGIWRDSDVNTPIVLTIVDTVPVYPTFKVTSVNDQTGAATALELLSTAPAASKLLEDTYLVAPSSARGSITYVQIVSPGKGYSEVVDSSRITITKADGSGPSAGNGAKLIPSLGVVGLVVANPGSGYNIAPKVYIDSPLHSSTAPQLYARSAEIATNGLVLLKAGHSYLPGGVYQLVPLSTAGGLHQSGNVNNSVDTVLTLRTGHSTDFASFQGVSGMLTQAAITNAIQTVVGSNYRVGDVLQLVPVGTTRSGAKATVKVTAVTDSIDYRSNPSGKFNGVPTNTGSGIMDYGHVDPNNGKDVGGYGTGYVSVPKVFILGGNQGVTTNCNIGVVDVDYATTNTDDQGTNYSLKDAIFSNSNESGSVKIGEVTQVDTSGGSTNGAILNWAIYEPYQSGLSKPPTISIQRQVVVPGSKDANFVAVMGITNVTIVTNASGFIGDAVLRVDAPFGAPSATVTPEKAIITANVDQEVATITFQEVAPNNPALYTKLPTISIAPPPGISRFLGWFGVRFDPKDAFEFIIQYTIAKAIAFQVDQDASLPGYYFVADSITIGGVTIPLRQPGGAGAQGREMSANRIIRKYMVRMIAV